MVGDVGLDPSWTFSKTVIDSTYGQNAPTTSGLYPLLLGMELQATCHCIGTRGAGCTDGSWVLPTSVATGCVFSVGRDIYAGTGG